MLPSSSQRSRNLSDGPQAPPSTEVNVLGIDVRTGLETGQASPAHCAGFQLGLHEPAHALPATAFSAGSLLGCMYSTGGSSDPGWAAGRGAAPRQVRSLTTKTAWLATRARAASALGGMSSPARLHCTDGRLLQARAATQLGPLRGHHLTVVEMPSQPALQQHVHIHNFA